MIVIGHRGARGLAPENTVAAMQKALEFGVDEIEIDVRTTVDGVVIVHHDPAVEGTGRKGYFIADCKYWELKRRKSDLATFEEIVKAVGKRVPLIVEVKPGQSVGPIVTIIKNFLAKGWRPKDFLLGSFNQKIMIELHRELPQIQKVVIESWSGLRAVRRAKQLSTNRLHMNHKWLWGGFIKSMSRSGYQVYAYTLNNPIRARRWIKYGLVGVLTDYPDRYKS